MLANRVHNMFPNIIHTNNNNNNKINTRRKRTQKGIQCVRRIHYTKIVGLRSWWRALSRVCVWVRSCASRSRPPCKRAPALSILYYMLCVHFFGVCVCVCLYGPRFKLVGQALLDEINIFTFQIHSRVYTFYMLYNIDRVRAPLLIFVDERHHVYPRAHDVRTRSARARRNREVVPPRRFVAVVQGEKNVFCSRSFTHIYACIYVVYNTYIIYMYNLIGE